MPNRQIATGWAQFGRDFENRAALGPPYHPEGTGGIIPGAGRFALRAAEVLMNRRSFLWKTGIAGAGLLGAGNAAPGLLRADTANNSDSNLTLEEKPVAFTVPPLPYSFDALEPYIDAKTMEIHHDKHHGAYVTNVNKALEGQAALQAKSIDDLLKGLDSVPENIRSAVRNNGGGHWNHSLFWTLMKKGGGGEPNLQPRDWAALVPDGRGWLCEMENCPSTPRQIRTRLTCFQLEAKPCWVWTSGNTRTT